MCATDNGNTFVPDFAVTVELTNQGIDSNMNEIVYVPDNLYLLIFGTLKQTTNKYHSYVFKLNKFTGAHQEGIKMEIDWNQNNNKHTGDYNLFNNRVYTVAKILAGQATNNLIFFVLDYDSFALLD